MVLEVENEMEGGVKRKYVYLNMWPVSDDAEGGYSRTWYVPSCDIPRLLANAVTYAKSLKFH